MNKQTKKKNKKNHNYQNSGYLGNLLKKSGLLINFLNLSQVLELEVRAFLNSHQTLHLTTFNRGPVTEFQANQITNVLF